MVRIEGDEVFILAVVEVLKVVLVGISISSISVVDHVWCVYNLRKYGEVTMYDNNICRVIDTAFGTFLKSITALGYRNEMSKKKDFSDNASLFARISQRVRGSRFLNIRTVFLISSVLLSVAEIISLFALSTEGKNVADKPEFGLRMEEASQVPVDAVMEWYNPHEGQVRYEYVFRRLGRLIQFKNNRELKIDIPRRLDVNKDEKWPYVTVVDADDKYATLHAKDFTVQERAKFIANAGQVTGTTESGIILRHYSMAKRDSDRKVCSGSMSGVSFSGPNGTITLCYTDELRNKSCANARDGDSITFEMKCSRIRVQRFGQNIVPGNGSLWWLLELANPANRGVGGASLMQMNSLRAYRGDPISPGALVVSALLTEFPSQILLTQRPFSVDVAVVIIPNWLLLSTAVTVSFIVILGTSAAIYAATRNLVLLNDWRELMIANLLNPGDSLNRNNRKEFRCVVGTSNDFSEREFRLYVEPENSITPVSGVRRDDIG